MLPIWKREEKKKRFALTYPNRLLVRPFYTRIKYAHPFAVGRYVFVVVVVFVVVRLFVRPPLFRLSTARRRGRRTRRRRGGRAGETARRIATDGAVRRRRQSRMGRCRRSRPVLLLVLDGQFEFLLNEQARTDVLHPGRRDGRAGRRAGHRVLGRGRTEMVLERVHHGHDRVDDVGRVRDATRRWQWQRDRHRHRGPSATRGRRIRGRHGVLRVTPAVRSPVTGTAGRRRALLASTTTVLRRRGSDVDAVRRSLPRRHWTPG